MDTTHQRRDREVQTLMATTNDVTGDAIKTKAPNQKYRDNYEQIFSKDKEAKTIPTETLKVFENDKTKV